MEKGRHGYLLFFGMLAINFLACTDPPVPKLTYYDREIVDSLYLIHYDSLRPELDTLCINIEREIMRTAVDSIMKKRLEEIAKLKNRYQQQ